MRIMTFVAGITLVVGASAQQADLSSISTVTGIHPGFSLHIAGPESPADGRRTTGGGTTEVNTGGGCPDSTKRPTFDVDGDGDLDTPMGDGNTDTAGNKVQAWCITDRGTTHVELLYDPAGPDGPVMLASCCFANGWNAGTVTVDPETGVFTGVSWWNQDMEGDDDGDGKWDEWDYKYDPTTNTLTVIHSENGVPQGDGPPAGPPHPAGSGGDFPPMTGSNDDPNQPPAGGSPAPEGTPVAEHCSILTSSIPQTNAGTMTVLTTVANEGPLAIAAGRVTIVVIPTSMVTGQPLVDGGPVALRMHDVVVLEGELLQLEDTFTIEGPDPGFVTYTITTGIVPTGSGVTDPVAADNSFTNNYNLTVADGAWVNLYESFPGTNYLPRLSGTGTLQPGTLVGLHLSSARPNALTNLLIALTSQPIPFKGGLITAWPAVSQIPLVTNSLGEVTLSANLTVGLPADTTLYLQCVTTDPLAPQGFSISNALLGVVPE